MRFSRTASAAIAVAAAILVAGCSNSDDGKESTSPAASSTAVVTQAPTASAAASSPSAAPARNDEPTAADTTAFVAAFRSAYPELSNGRRDNPIANLLANTCQEISIGKEPHIIVSNTGKRAAYQDVSPTPEQAQAIYDLVSEHCPS
ncbi:hypothetical protein [Prescottella equi]|uniref:hypothetical protein n=1 Tax=Rhodococcus hoagii TaxID=43767 RepID=UPI003B7F12F7